MEGGGAERDIKYIIRIRTRSRGEHASTRGRCTADGRENIATAGRPNLPACLTPAAAPFTDSIVFTCAAYTIPEQIHTSVIAPSFGRACSAKTAPTARCLTRS